MELALAQYLGLRNKAGEVLRFQNYWINQTVDFEIDIEGTIKVLDHNFLPFGFSGISTDRQGDLREATLVFPNNTLSRGIVDTAVSERWFATVRTIVPTDPTTPSASRDQILFTYVGVITTASWSDETINVSVSTVLDAVGADTPTRRITRSIVGSIPTTSSVRL
jgi:hypothetical protein